MILKFLIMTPSLSKHDAVSNDVEKQQEFLEAAGHQAYVYSQYKDEYFEPKVVSRKKALEILAEKDPRVIYHHSIEWHQGEQMLETSNCPVIFRYHNVTPEQYLKDNPELEKQVIQARWQTQKFIDSGKIIQYLNASPYNSKELKGYGVDEAKLDDVAPFHKIDDFAGCEEVAPLREKLQSEPLKILFVGRLLRHKGHHNLCKVIDRYIDAYGKDIRLYIVGKAQEATYLTEVAKFINERRLGSIVKVHHQASFDELYTYYRHCDLFVCMSEHEGFGVPILEAQYHRLPIIALARTAVTDTIGPDQMLIEDIDHDKFAAAIRVLQQNEEMKEFLRDRGEENYKKYTIDQLRAKFLEVVTSA